jgi:sugar O-acyltransferase (sialic acid O-acetyltransferase NeuD family)
MAHEIVIFGSGGHARCTAEAADAQGRWKVRAFISREPPHGATVLGRPVDAEAEWLARPHPPLRGVVAVGDNWVRQQIAERILQAVPEFEFCEVIHPRAVVSSSATLASGTIILAGSVIASCARIGRHGLAYTNAVIEHDNVLADYCSLGPGAVLGGAVTLGLRTFVGLGARVIHNVSIGDDVVIGAGATIVDDVPNNALVVGTPGRIVAQRAVGEPYL